VSNARGQRIADCTKSDANTRLRQSRKFLEVAQLVETEADTLETSASVAASLAVLAGIAASDAACCAALRMRSRAQDHKAAVDLVRQIEPGGRVAAGKLDRLLDLKDSAQYGVISLSTADLKVAMRNAAALVEFASEVMRRG